MAQPYFSATPTSALAPAAVAMQPSGVALLPFCGVSTLFSSAFEKENISSKTADPCPFPDAHNVYRQLCHVTPGKGIHQALWGILSQGLRTLNLLFKLSIHGSNSILCDSPPPPLCAFQGQKCSIPSSFLIVPAIALSCTLAS